MAKKPNDRQRTDARRIGRGGTGKLDTGRKEATRRPGRPGLVIGPSDSGSDVDVVPRRLAGVSSRGKRGTAR